MAEAALRLGLTMWRHGERPMLLLAFWALGFLGSFHPAYSYYYSSNCYYSCNQAYFSPSYVDCLNACGTCYYYRCYSSFQPSFSGSEYLYGNCSCYWPWWSWVLLVIGISLIVGGLVYGCLAYSRRRRAEKEAEAYQQQQMAAQGAYPEGTPPAAPGYPPPAPGYPAQWYPPQGYAPDQPGYPHGQPGYPPTQPGSAPAQPGYPATGPPASAS